jgi:hypothetical protein
MRTLVLQFISHLRSCTYNLVGCDIIQTDNQDNLKMPASESSGTSDTLPVVVPKDFDALLSYFPEHPAHGIKPYVTQYIRYDCEQMQLLVLTLVEVLKRRSE